MIVARSFARIHETNLKVCLACAPSHVSKPHKQKQGVLPLWFANKQDYALIGSGDKIESEGLADLMAGKSGVVVRLKVTKVGTGEVKMIETKHTMSEDQLKWLKAGCALNYIRAQRAKSR